MDAPLPDLSHLKEVKGSFHWRPLITESGGSWQVNDGVPDVFLAALEVHNRADKTRYWWIRQCTIQDEIGLCEMVGDDYEPCGWEAQDIQYWMPIINPSVSKSKGKRE
jgi:hypothetical protein